MLTLSERDRAMLAGDRGPAAQLAMSIVVRMAAVYGASELMDVSQAHIDSTIYLGDATLEFAERLASLGARVAVPTSLNVSGVDECGWKDWAVSPEWAAKAAPADARVRADGRVADVDLRALPDRDATVVRPAGGVGRIERHRVRELGDRGTHRALSGSAGRVLRHHRPCSRGRPPSHGESRRRTAAPPRARAAGTAEDDQFFAVLGHLVGKLAGDSIPVIDGVSVQPAEDQLKAFRGAPPRHPGRVALFHMVGVTPEAPTLDAAFQGRTVPAATTIGDRGSPRRAPGADDGRWPGAGHGDSRQPAFLGG